MSVYISRFLNRLKATTALAIPSASYPCCKMMGLKAQTLVETFSCPASTPVRSLGGL